MRFSPAFAFVLVAMPCGIVSANPAARMTDPTSHGGQVVAGSPTVLIGGRPAARLGDMAVCPLSDGPVPHVGGPIVTGAATVLISGMPAARVGDTIAESVPSVIVVGAPTVLIGGGASAAPAPAGGPATSR
jgi:uncharacterized Zn-binding protein involved in type VI secretion